MKQEDVGRRREGTGKGGKGKWKKE